jgi:putative transposase
MRPKRILQDGAVYHVTSKVDHDAMGLKTFEVKKEFMAFIERAHKKFKFELINFQIMNNHFHFLIKPGKNESLSEIMQWIKCNFAKYWNNLHKTKGHFWGERFFSRIIKNAKDFWNTFRYIDDNAVKANLAKSPLFWLFGGAWFHRFGKMPVIEIAEWGSVRDMAPYHLPAG